MIGESALATPWAVHCKGGCTPPFQLIYLTEEECIRQMEQPWATWRCPRCGGEASWDDQNYEESISDEPSDNW